MQYKSKGDNTEDQMVLFQVFCSYGVWGGFGGGFGVFIFIQQNPFLK